MRSVGRAVVLAAVASSTVIALSASPVQAATAKQPAVQFRPVLTTVAPASATTTSATTTSAPVDLAAARATVASCDVAAVEALAVIPTTSKRAAKSDACVVFPDESGGASAPRYYLGPAADMPVDRARSRFQSGQGWVVELQLSKAGAKAWDRLGEQQFHQQVAITLDGSVVAAPVIQPDDATFTSFGGTAVFSGAFSQKEARAVAAAARLAQGR